VEQRSLGFPPLNLIPQTLSLTEKMTKLSLAKVVYSCLLNSELSVASEDILSVLGMKTFCVRHEGSLTIINSAGAHQCRWKGIFEFEGFSIF